MELILPDELVAELQDAAKERNCSPLQFAQETVEAELATRRLSRVTVGRCGPRIGAPVIEEHEPEPYSVRLEGIAHEQTSI